MACYAEGSSGRVVVEVSHIDWGSVPAWVAALITSTSAAVAVISYSRSLYDKAREQAAQISCRVVSNFVVSITGPDKSEVVAVDFEITNRSDSPVYDLEVTFSKSKIIGKPLLGDRFPPGVTATGRTQIQKRYRSKISPGADEIRTTSTSEIPILTFTDALGRRWRKRNSHIRRARQKAQWFTVLQKTDIQDIPYDQTTWDTVSQTNQRQRDE
jgi:hypothetical protein